MKPLRKVWLAGLAAAAVVLAQDTPPKPAALAAPDALSVLEQAVRQKTADWQKLADGLDASTKHLLPCDPKATVAITEVNKASDARITAIAEYFQEAEKQAALQTAAARRVQASIPQLAADLTSQSTDVAEEQQGVSTQSAALTSAQGGDARPTFALPQEELRRITALEMQRADSADTGWSHAIPASVALRDFVAQLEARESSLKEAHNAFASEGSRWSAYYASRLARAQTECAITKGLPATAPVPQTKQNQGKQK